VYLPENLIMKMPGQIKSKEALYISYDGLLDPLGKSQIIPYLKALVKKDIKFLVLSFEKHSNLLDKPNVARLKNELDSARLMWKGLRYHKSPPVLATFFDISKGILSSLWFVKRYRIKIIHARSYVASFIAIILKKICRVKFIFDMRGFWADERVEAGIWKKGGLLYKAAKYFEKAFLKNADVIVSLTHAAKDEIKSFSYLKNNEIDVSYIPTCVDLRRFRQKQTSDLEIIKKIKGRFILVYSGSISTWYMPNEMIDFFSVVKKYISEAYLLVLTKEKELFSKIARNKGLKDSSFSVLSLSYESVPDYLSLGQVGLAFYKSGYSRKGCSPTKVGEYLACGLPVIINTGIGDSDGILEPGRVGIIIKDFSNREYERVQQQLRQLIKDSDIKARCRKVAEKYFALDLGLEEYQKIYYKLLKNSRSYPEVAV